MKRTLLAISAVLAATGWGGTAAADQNAKAAYAAGVAAVKAGNCAVAVQRLTDYESLDSAWLNQHGDFKKRVDDQIMQCRVSIYLKVTGALVLVPRK